MALLIVRGLILKPLKSLSSSTFDVGIIDVDDFDEVYLFVLRLSTVALFPALFPENQPALFPFIERCLSCSSSLWTFIFFFSCFLSLCFLFHHFSSLDFSLLTVNKRKSDEKNIQVILISWVYVFLFLKLVQ